MQRIRSAIEGSFETLAFWLCRRAWWVIAAVALASAAVAGQAAKLRVDTSPEGMLHESDEIRVAYDEFREEFGRDALIVIGVPAPVPFDRGFLERIEALHRDLETQVPHVREVTSLVDVRYTRGEGDEFVVGELLEDWRARGGDAASLQRFAVTHPLYRDNLVSSTGTLAALVVETEAVVLPDVSAADALAAFDEEWSAAPAANGSEPRYLSSRENAEVIDAIAAVLDRHTGPDFAPVLSGTPVIVDAFDRTTMSDLAVCASASAIGIVLVLALFFRRVSGVVIPNLVVCGSIAMTFGLMGLLDAPFTLASNAILPVLIAVGVCSAVHVLAIFYRRFESDGDKRAAIAYALGHAGPAVVMTSLTTAAGLFSFAMGELASTADVGRFASAGVMLCLVLTILLVPALLEVSPIRRGVRSPAGSTLADRSLVGLAAWATRHHKPILVASGVLFAISLVGIADIRFSHDPVSYFDRETRVRSDLETIDRELRGGTTLEVVIDSGRENGLHDPELLHAVDRLARELPERTKDILPVARVFSMNDIVKETNQALHANDRSAYLIPRSRETLTQELFLFENSGSGDLDRLVDPAFQRTRVSIKTPYADGVVYRAFVEEVRRHFEDGLQGRASVEVTGSMALEAQVMPKALRTMAESYVSAFIVISLLMILFLGSLRIGLASMVPNLLPIALAMGAMGFLDVPIDMTTITIGSIGLGLVVDDTIHFMYNFQKYHQQTGRVRRAVEESFLGAGRAMIVTSLVLLSAFWVDLLASLSNVVRFGMFVGVIVILALLADFLVAPALMSLLARRPRRSRLTRRLAANAAGLGALMALIVSLPAPAAGLDAREIMQRVEDRDDGSQVAMQLHMILLDGNGHRRERRALSWSRDREAGTDSLLFFVEPADVRDTGFLTLDHADPGRTDDQWLFLPALGRSKRISSREKSRAFMGSDFSYADMTRRSTERYEYRLMGEKDVKGHPTWQIESLPRDEDEAAETGYRRSILFVRQDNFVIVRAVHWLRDSDRLKLFDVKELERIDGIWTPTEIHMSTLRGRELEHRTILLQREVRYDESLPASDFTTGRLERGP